VRESPPQASLTNIQIQTMATLSSLFRPLRPSTALCLMPLLVGGASAGEHSRRLLSQAAATVEPTAGSDASIAGAAAGAVAAFLMVALVLGIFMMRRNAAQKVVPSSRSDDGSVKGKKSLSKKGDDSEAAPQTSLIYMTFNDVQVRSAASSPVPSPVSSEPPSLHLPGWHLALTSRLASPFPCPLLAAGWHSETSLLPLLCACVAACRLQQRGSSQRLS